MVLRRVFEDGAYADRALQGEAKGLDARDRALAMRLVYGTVQRKGTLDHLAVEVELMPNVVPTSEVRKVVAESVRHHIKSIIGVTAEVIVKEPGEIPRSMGKAVRVRDLRPKLS